MRLWWTGIVAACAVGVSCGGDSTGEDGGGTEGSSSSGESDPTQGPSGTSQGPSGTTAGPSTSGTNTTDPTTDTMDESGTETTGEEIEVLELRAGGFQPPQTETFYSCFSFNYSFDALRHIVGFRPAVTSPLIHHYVLSLADEEITLDPGNSCFEWPAAILWAWAPGIEDTLLPPEAGILLGDSPGGVHTFILQVHYNNPLAMAYTDNDGIDVLVTPDLRPNPAAIFSQGDIYTIQIPPGNPAFPYQAICSGAQTAGMLPHPINVFSSFLHAHEIGSAMRTDVFRDDQLVGTVAEQDPFDFNMQRFQDTDVTIEPGDRIETTCTYDSTGRTGVTSGGAASNEEMCINFMMYYPAIAAEKCGVL